MAHATTQVVTALSRALRRNADVLAQDLARARRGEAGAVHRVRVATRRLRAALPLAAEAAGFDARALRHDLREVTRALGPVREGDVVRELLLDVAEREGWSPLAVARVEAACLTRRGRQQSAMCARLSRLAGRDLESRTLAAASRLMDESPDVKATAVVLAHLRRRARQLAETLGEAGTVYGVDSLHQVRLASKKLRYALEAADGILAGPEGRARRRLKRFQERLGRIHDAQTAQHYLRAAAAKSDVTLEMSSRLECLDRALEIQCRRLHAQVLSGRGEIVETIQELLRGIAGRVAPRHVGRMARMRTGRLPRRSIVAT